MNKKINLNYLPLIGLIITAIISIIWGLNTPIIEPEQPANISEPIIYYDTVYFEHGDGMILREREQFFNDTTFVNHSEIR